MAEGVAAFLDNGMIARLEARDLEMADYHRLLLTLFHQTYEGPSTFALAGFHTPLHFEDAREYLMHHAEEEAEHWKWVITDLKKTGYEGPDPRSFFPCPATQAYVAFNVYTATRHPLARLAIAAVLEGIGGRHGTKYGRMLLEQLGLRPEQATFFLAHGELDKGHVEEVFAIIDTCALSEAEWAWMAHAARTAGVLYSAMYTEAAKKG